jgi:hypothetical protein
MIANRRRLGLALIALIAGGLSLLLAALSAGESARLAALLLTGHSAQATVVDTRVMHSRRTGPSHELRYRLASGAGHSDATGRADLWVSLPEADWEAARRSGQLTVRVSDAWPGLSAPAAGLTAQAGDLIAAWALAGTFGLITVAVVWSAARGPAPRRARAG